MARKTVEFLNPVSFNIDDEEWYVVDSNWDDGYFSVDKYDVKLILTEKFNPKLGDKLHMKPTEVEVEVKGIDGDTLWVKSVGSGYYTTLRSQFKEYDA